MDTGAQCNIIPIKLFQNAAQDKKLRNVTPTKSNITAYGGATLPVMGTVVLKVKRGRTTSTLHCKLVYCVNIRPLLGRNSCLQMKSISYLDNDQINRPATGSLPVYALDITSVITKEQLIKQHPRVFGPGNWFSRGQVPHLY